MTQQDKASKDGKQQTAPTSGQGTGEQRPAEQQAAPTSGQGTGEQRPAEQQQRQNQEEDDANTGTEMRTRLEPAPVAVIKNGTVISDSSERIRWRVIGRLGAGAYGAVFRCEKAKEPAEKVVYALKVEQSTAPIQFLALEVQVYKALSSGANGVLAGMQPHYSELHDRGIWQNFNFIVMTLFGPSIEDLRRTRERNRFSMGTALVIARQTLKGLNQLHAVGYLHRDIKPANFSIGLGTNSGIVYMLDFGMARKFVNERGVLKRPRAGRIGFRGTTKYASISGHLMREQARCDDLESWFYMACELIKGKLPWHHLDDATEILLMKWQALRPNAPPPVKRPAATPPTAEATTAATPAGAATTAATTTPTADPAPATGDATKTKSEERQTKSDASKCKSEEQQTKSAASKSKSDQTKSTASKPTSEENQTKSAASKSKSDQTKSTASKPTSEEKKMKKPKSKSKSEKKTKKSKSSARDRGGKPKATPQKMLMGSTPRQFGPMLALIVALRYYDTPPYNELSELIDAAIVATHAVTTSLDWEAQGGGGGR